MVISSYAFKWYKVLSNLTYLMRFEICNGSHSLQCFVHNEMVKNKGVSDELVSFSTNVTDQKCRMTYTAIQQSLERAWAKTQQIMWLARWMSNMIMNWTQRKWVALKATGLWRMWVVTYVSQQPAIYTHHNQFPCKWGESSLTFLMCLSLIFYCIDKRHPQFTKWESVFSVHQVRIIRSDALCSQCLDKTHCGSVVPASFAKTYTALCFI